MTYAVNAARRLKRALKTTDIIRVTEQLGIIYEELPLPHCIRGFTGKLRSKPYIVVNRDLPRPWVRAVAFHELGHIQLHSHLPNHFCISEHTLFSISRLECQANTFAAEYLIPDETLLIGQDIRLIAAELDIPAELFSYKRPPIGGLCVI